MVRATYYPGSPRPSCSKAMNERPTAILPLYHNGKLYLYFTLSVAEAEGKIYSYTAMSSTRDLKNWSAIKILTPQNQALDYCSPGNVIWYKGEWIMCLESYPRPGYTVEQQPRYGTKEARLY